MLSVHSEAPVPGVLPQASHYLHRCVLRLLYQMLPALLAVVRQYNFEAPLSKPLSITFSFS
jgi:hypothetical protein